MEQENIDLPLKLLTNKAVDRKEVFQVFGKLARPLLSLATNPREALGLMAGLSEATESILDIAQGAYLMREKGGNEHVGMKIDLETRGIPHKETIFSHEGGNAIRFADEVQASEYGGGNARIVFATS